MKLSYPFEEIFTPFIQSARQSLINRLGKKYRLLSNKAHTAIDKSLLKQLCKLCAPSLEIEFSIFRAQNHIRKPVETTIKRVSKNISRKQYEQFIGRMLNSSLSYFFMKYNVLVGLSKKISDFWVDAIGEFITRLNSDIHLIQKTFQYSTNPGLVIDVKPDLSDRHQNGRSAIALTFESGLKLIYKPRNLGIEKAYFIFLNWLNENGASPPFKALKVIDRVKYGWVEYVEHLPCQSELDVRNYYKQAGMLLFVLSILNARDCHYENLIAYGDKPVIVDLEALLHPEINDNYQAMKNKVTYSAHNTGLLPQIDNEKSHKMYDFSGLNGYGGQKTYVKKYKWINTNTDQMRIDNEFINTPSLNNHPILNGVKQSPKKYIDEIICGFKKMHLFFLKHKGILLSPNSPLKEFSNKCVRFIFRSSQIYSSIIKRSIYPKYLRDKEKRSHVFDVLKRTFNSNNSNRYSHLWSIVDFEKQALWQMDIPYFTTYSNSKNLKVGTNRIIENCFQSSGYDLVIKNIKNLSESDCMAQVGSIRQSLDFIIN